MGSRHWTFQIDQSSHLGQCLECWGSHRAVGSGQVESGQCSGDSGQWRVENAQWTVDSGQESSGQWAVGNGQWAVDSGQISDFQHAYGSKGTDIALSTLVNLIESAILRKQLCLVISVDIQGAFDNLAFMAIEKVMKDNNYPPLMIRWFMNFLKNRIAIAEVLGV